MFWLKSKTIRRVDNKTACWKLSCQRFWKEWRTTTGMVCNNYEFDFRQELIMNQKLIYYVTHERHACV